MKPRALLDCDGVVANFTHHVWHCAHQLAGLKTPSDTPTFQNYKFLPEVSALTSTPEKDITNAISSPGFCETIPPFPGARAFVEALSLTHEVVIVTSPWYSPTWVSERYAWLANHLNIHRKNVIFAQRKELIQGDILIDDRQINLTCWLQANVPIKEGLCQSEPAMVDQPINIREPLAVWYNPTPPHPKGAPLPTALRLCNSYDDILAVAKSQV